MKIKSVPKNRGDLQACPGDVCSMLLVNIFPQLKTTGYLLSGKKPIFE